MANDPIAQFRIENYVTFGRIGESDVAFTNSGLFMLGTVGAAAVFLLAATSGRTLVPSRLQSVAELLFDFVVGTVRETMGREGMRFVPLLFTLFVFILLGNLFGMFPYFFTITSHIIVTFSLAFLVIGLVVGYGIYRHGAGWFRLFVPSGIPAPLLVLIVPIEIISFVSRPISLSLRLFANMLAGHVTLKLFAGFVVGLGSLGVLGVLGAIVPFVMVVAMTALEFLVAFLQAYVFFILSCVYLNDALHPGH